MCFGKDPRYSRFDNIPDHVFRNICANQTRLHFVIFARLFVQVPGTNRPVYETTAYGTLYNVPYALGMVALTLVT